MSRATDTTVRVARDAMATRFEAVLHGDAPERLRAAAEEALDEIARTEDLLSAFRPHSALARVNDNAGRGWTRVDPRLFAFLKRILALAAETGGAFDPTVGRLVRLWNAARENSRLPDPADIALAQTQSGWEHVELDATAFAVRFLKPGLRIDPGAAGKGHALDAAIEILREAGIENALLHGGTSSVSTIGCDPSGAAWAVALPQPPPGFAWQWPGGSPPRIELRDTTLSVSAVWGRSFESGGRAFGHVIDPRSGEPVDRSWLSAVVNGSAMDGDALSTALLVRGAEGMATARGRCWLVESDGHVHIPSA